MALFHFSNQVRAENISPRTEGLQRFLLRVHSTCFAHLSFAKVQSCLRSEFVLSNLANNSATGQTGVARVMELFCEQSRAMELFHEQRRVGGVMKLSREKLTKGDCGSTVNFSRRWKI